MESGPTPALKIFPAGELLAEAAAKGNRARPPGGDIDAAARDFEAMFVTQMLRPMWAGLEVDPFFGGGSGEETWRSLLLNEYGKTAARGGGLGIAPLVRAELLRIQELAA